MAKIDGNELDKLVAEFGEPEYAEKISAEIVARYRGLIPDVLINFWIAHGFGGYQSGKFWITDPDYFRPVIECVFENDPEFLPNNLYTIYRGAFAEIGVWDASKKCIVDVSFNINLASTNNFEGWISEDSEVKFSIEEIVAAIIYRKKHTEGWVDDEDREMLDDAVQRYGFLGPDEMYGFFPALQFGGKNSIDNVRRVKAVEHLLFLAQAADLKLQNFIMPDAQGQGGGFELIRPIGPNRI